MYSSRKSLNAPTQLSRNLTSDFLSCFRSKNSTNSLTSACEAGESSLTSSSSDFDCVLITLPKRPYPNERTQIEISLRGTQRIRTKQYELLPGGFRAQGSLFLVGILQVPGRFFGHAEA